MGRKRRSKNPKLLTFQRAIINIRCLFFQKIGVNKPDYSATACIGLTVIVARFAGRRRARKTKIATVIFKLYVFFAVERQPHIFGGLLYCFFASRDYHAFHPVFVMVFLSHDMGFFVNMFFDFIFNLFDSSKKIK